MLLPLAPRYIGILSGSNGITIVLLMAIQMDLHFFSYMPFQWAYDEQVDELSSSFVQNSALNPDLCIPHANCSSLRTGF